MGGARLWGLDAGGKRGAQRILKLLRDELERAMVLAGQPDVTALDPDLVVRRR